MANGVRPARERELVIGRAIDRAANLFLVGCTVCTFQPPRTKWTCDRALEGEREEGRVTRQVQLRLDDRTGPHVDVVRSVRNGLKKRYIYTAVHGADQKKLYSHNSGLHRSAYTASRTVTTRKMAVPSENVMNTSLDDPVTKAVVDNIMGNLPTKKPLVRCEDCDLSFTSQAVLDTHLQGARHAKQVRSKNIMATLEETKISFTKDEETNGLKCNVCNVCLNSIQQLQTHLNGSRHKKKLMRGNNKSYMVRKTLPYGLKTNRFMYLDKLEKNTVVLVYSLVLFAFACLTLLLTFAFHFFL